MIILEDCRIDDTNPVFKLSELTKMYTERIQQMGEEVTNRVHSTRLKRRILAYCPGLTEYRDGGSVLLAFDQDIANILNIHKNKNDDDEAIILAQVAKIVRRDMLKMERTSFNGNFTIDCQEKALPRSLISLIEMILGGPNIINQSSNIIENQAALTIGQLIR